jgi:NAD+ kinase
MPGNTTRALIVANLDKDDAGTVAEAMESRLGSLGVEATVYAFSGDPGAPPSAAECDVAVSLGGDGTVLYTARIAAPLGIPVFPVNLGRLGFIAEIGRNEWEEAFASWLEGTLPVSERLMLSIETIRGGEPLSSFCALNDGVVSGQGIAKLIGLQVGAGGSALGAYRADGIIVATPTGSTAYNLAAGGPILHPEMEAMVFNPVCPFTLSNRPLVVPADETIEILVQEGRAGVILTADGQETFVLEPGDLVRITRAPFKARILVSKSFAFYDVLRSKLAWSGGPDA